MNPNESNEQDIFKTGISISQTQPWFNSILQQLRQRREDGPRAQITAAPDTSVLDKFVEPPSLLKSIMATAKGMLADRGRTIQMTATPLEVEELWAKNSHGVPGILSVGLHVLLVVVLVIPAYLILKTPPATPTSVTVLYAPTMPVMPVMKDKSGGGGGGGRKALTPPSKGQLPRGADKQIVPPMVEFKNLAPELAVETTVIAPQLSMMTPLPNIAFGDPNGVSGPLSAGPGTGGGIGTGTGSGIGSGKGGGVGPGEGGGIGGGVFNVGGGVSEPVLLSQVQPEYSDDGRKARIQGTVELLIIVNPDGTVKFDNVRKNLGYGLDQKAIDAVKKWKFVPGKKDGKAVATYVSVLVNFSLR